MPLKTPTTGTISEDSEDTPTGTAVTILYHAQRQKMNATTATELIEIMATFLSPCRAYPSAFDGEAATGCTSFGDSGVEIPFG